MSKLKTALSLSTLLIMSSVAHAGWEGNFLFGVSGGYGERSGNLNVDVIELATGETVSGSVDLNRSGGFWGLLTGYQARCNGWLVGGELAVDWPNRHQTNSFYFVDADGDEFLANGSYKQDALVALTGRLGYEVNCFFLPYARFGIEGSRDKFNVNGINTNGAVGTIGFNADGSRTNYRWIAGIGAEMPVPVLSGLSFRLEYNYHSKGRGISGSTVTTDNEDVIYASTKQHANTGKASLVYNFL